MVPRNLVGFMYSDSEAENCSCSDNDICDCYDSDWEGFPSGIDLTELGS